MKNNSKRMKYMFGGDDPTTPPAKKTYTSQQEIDTANKFAANFAVRHHIDFDPLDSHVATKVGDPVVEFIDSVTGKPYQPRKSAGLGNFTIPTDLKLDDIKSDGTDYWYDDAHTGDMVYVDPSVIQTPRFKKPKDQNQQVIDKRSAMLTTPKTYSDGTDDIGVQAKPNAAIGLLQYLPSIIQGISSITQGNQDYSQQPIVNANTMRTMTSPYNKYAYGGDVGSAAMDQLQSIADEQGMTVEELVEMIQNNQDDSGDGSDTTDTDNDVASEDDGDEDDTTDDTSSDDGGSTDASDARFAYGGMAGRVPIEVENKEVVQTPNGAVKQMKGKTHAEGGIDINVPPGTKIYSNRIKGDDGRTMQERKLSRERKMDKLDKLLANNPKDRLLKNTINRTKQVHAKEEAADMETQKAVAMSKGRKYGTGGRVPIDPIKYDNPLYKIMGIPDPTIQEPTGGPVTNKTLAHVDQSSELAGNRLTLGDIIGIGGNLFNAIAPMVNTNQDLAATKPHINRFRGFGRNAIAANDAAQDYVDTQRTDTNTDIDSSINSARIRNRNSASSVNTLRSLDALTEMTNSKAKASTNDAFSKEMMALLGQRSGLEMNVDNKVMTGETMRDQADEQTVDNYFSNRGADLTNFGTNIQGIGGALNINKSNQVDAKLISQLSKYGLGIDDNGNLITVK